MKAAFAGTEISDPPTTSSIVRCHLITRTDDPAPYLFYDKGDGSMIVNLEGYLICPLDMFTPRQREMASKKYTKAQR